MTPYKTNSNSEKIEIARAASPACTQLPLLRSLLLSLLASLLISLPVSSLITLSIATPAQAWGWKWPTENPYATSQEAPGQTPIGGDSLLSRWRERTATVEASDAAEPITMKGGMRHPLLFYRQIANRPWAIGRLFFFLVLVSALLKLFLPGLTTLATQRCRTNCYASLSSAFIYSTVLIVLVRFAFYTDDLTAMGVFTFGLLQLSFALGGCLGANLFAQNLYSFVTSKKAPSGRAGKVLIYSICLLTVVGVMTVVSMIPNLGHLPRVGNRMVMLVAFLGLGGLVNLVVGFQKQP